jgi:hypothetical protein
VLVLVDHELVDDCASGVIQRADAVVFLWKPVVGEGALVAVNAASSFQLKKMAGAYLVGACQMEPLVGGCWEDARVQTVAGGIYAVGNAARGARRAEVDQDASWDPKLPEASVYGTGSDPVVADSN